jgi:hypothetical protein
MEPNNKNIDNINETLDLDELEKVAGGSQAAFISNAGVAGVAGAAGVAGVAGAAGVAAVAGAAKIAGAAGVAGAANNASNGLIGSRKNDGGLSRF